MRATVDLRLRPCNHWDRLRLPLPHVIKLERQRGLSQNHVTANQLMGSQNWTIKPCHHRSFILGVSRFATLNSTNLATVRKCQVRMTRTTICTLENFQAGLEVLISRIFREDTLYILKLLVTFRANLLPPRRPTQFATELPLYFILSMNISLVGIKTLLHFQLICQFAIVKTTIQTQQVHIPSYCTLPPRPWSWLTQQEASRVPSETRDVLFHNIVQFITCFHFYLFKHRRFNSIWHQRKPHVNELSLCVF
jgi:hypothetical protein